MKSEFVTTFGNESKMTCTTTLILFGLTNALHFSTGVAAMFWHCVYPLTLLEAMGLGASFLPLFIIIHMQKSVWRIALACCVASCGVFLASVGISHSTFDPLLFVAFAHGFATPCCVSSLIKLV